MHQIAYHGPSHHRVLFLPFTLRLGRQQDRMDSALLNQTNLTTESSVDSYFYVVAYSLFFIVGFPANCLSLYVAWMLMRKGNNMAVYLVSLSISDLLYTVTLPVWIELAKQTSIDGGLCSSVAVIMYNSFYIGSGLLCCISVDRYLAVVYPLHFHWVREVRTAVVVNFAVWILEPIIHLILLNHRGALQDFSSKYLCEDPAPMTQKDADQAFIRISLGFIVPVVIMTFCFQQIMRSLKQSTSILEQERRKIGLLLFALLLTYIVAFVPYQIVMLLRAILEPRDCSWAAKLKDAYLVTVTTTTLNSVLDPILYCLISESAQNEVRKALEKARGVLMWRKWPNSSNGIDSIS